MKSKTWVLSTLPLGKKALGCKWIFKVKYKLDGSLDKYKACIVTKGYAQYEGVYYEETFAPTAKMVTFRLVISISAHSGWKIYRWMLKVPWCKVLVWMVKSLYGLKQAPQAWYFKPDRYLRDSRIRKTYYEPTCYVINNDDDIVKLFCLCWWSSHLQKQCQQDSTSEIWYLIYFWNY